MPTYIPFYMYTRMASQGNNRLVVMLVGQNVNLKFYTLKF